MNLRFDSALGPLCALATVGCGPAVAPSTEDLDAAEDALATTYAELEETLGPEDVDRWIAARRAIVAGFDRICGDTICSGDYSNLTTVRLTCSSTRAARKLKDCTWVLGASIDDVDPRTGAIRTEARTFPCPIPVASTARAMLDVLGAAGDDALYAPLPGTGESFYDGLTACFEGVVGEPRPPVPPRPSYTELGDELWTQSTDAAVAWIETRRKLAASFEQACGDAFCEGEYPHIAPLRFVCSLHRSTMRVGRCSWSFALAETSVDDRGRIVVRTTTKTCDVEIGASAAALTSALEVNDPLRATLPGRETSIYESLIGCL